MKFEISKSSLDIFEAGMKQLEDLAIKRQESASRLMIAVADLRELVKTMQNYPDPDWMGDLVEKAKDPDAIVNEPRIMDTPDGDGEPIKPDDPGVEVPPPEPSFTLGNLLDEISNMIARRRADAYSSLKSTWIPNSENEIWNAVYQTLESSKELSTADIAIYRSLGSKNVSGPM